ncbi:MAG TPA: hypothetical protein VF739_14155 [Ktedonobacterales bacterium]
MQPSSQQPPSAQQVPDATGDHLQDERRINRAPDARGIWRFAVPVYLCSAIALIPWIIGLVIVQPGAGYVRHLDWVALGIVLLLTAGALATGALCALHWRQAAIAATFMATVAFVTAWFSVLALIRHTKTLLIALMILAPLTCLMLWVAVRVVRSRDSGWNMPHWVGGACFAFPALSALWIVGSRVVDAVFYGNTLSTVVEARQLRVAWGGLDLFELAAMLVTVYCIRRGSPWMVVAASVVGGLLCCDAWVDVMTSSGLDQALGVALAFVELPLAAYSLALAARVARAWGERAVSSQAIVRSR